MLLPPAELVGRAKATITECSVADTRACLNSDTLLIDVREAEEFQKSRIPGAVHVPRGLLEFQIHKVVETLRSNQHVAVEEQPIVLYCGIGARSALAAETMENLGYCNVRSMAGGMSAWLTANLPVES